MDSFAIVLKTAKEDTNKIKTFLAAGEELLYWSDEERPKSLGYLNQALMLSEKINSPYHQIESLLLLATYANGSRDHQRAIKYVKEALLVAERINDQVKISRCYNWMGSTYQEQGQNEEAARSFNLALDAAFKSGDRTAVMGCYGSLGMFFMHKNPPSYPEAIRYSLMTLKIAEETGDIETMHAALNNIGLMYSQLEDYSRSLQYYKLMKEKTKTNPFLGNIIGSYSGLKDYEGGITTINEYISRFEADGNKESLSSALFQLGLFYKEIAEDLYIKNKNSVSISDYLDKAITQFNRSEKMNENLKVRYKVYSRSYIYGETYKLKAKLALVNSVPNDSLNMYLKTAFASLKQQLNDTTPQSFRRIIGRCYASMGEVLAMQAGLASSTEKIKKYNQALKYLDTALVFGRSIPDPEASRDAYFAQADIFMRLRMYNKSFDALRKYDEVKDSIKSRESREKLEQVRISNEIILGTTEEKARYENMIKDMRSNFLKKEDSLAFEKALANERFIQNQKEIVLKQAELNLANQQKELNLFKFLKTQAELESELIRREQQDKQLTIVNQEKNLQQNQLQLQKTQLDLKETQIQAQDKQRTIYLGSIGILSVVFGLIYLNVRNRQKTERLVAAERMKSEKAIASHQMAELELQSLRAQLNPHFMFNSLNAIQELILKEDTENSHLYLSRFSDLVRMLLDNANQPFLTLKKEISLLEHYLSLENLRVPDLRYSIELDPSIDASTLLIPNMILQPYIENAIWHGLSHKKGDRKLSLKILKQEHIIVCQIEDNGVGRKKAAELKSLQPKYYRSKGTELLSKRFSLLSAGYKTNIETLTEDLYLNGAPSGTLVTIKVPLSLSERVAFEYSLS